MHALPVAFEHIRGGLEEVGDVVLGSRAIREVGRGRQGGKIISFDAFPDFAQEAGRLGAAALGSEKEDEDDEGPIQLAKQHAASRSDIFSGRQEPGLALTVFG